MLCCVPYDDQVYWIDTEIVVGIFILSYRKLLLYIVIIRSQSSSSIPFSCCICKEAINLQ